GIDPSSVEGLADTPYGVPNRRFEYVMRHEAVPVGFWRSVGNSQNAFFAESFIDEMAHAAKQDPVAFRLALLADKPRHRAVLEKAAQTAGWGTAAPAGRFRGVALHESFGSIVAEVAEISLDGGKTLRVHKVTCAIDCGRAMNPDTVVAQMESGVVFGLTAAFYGEIMIKDGRVDQANFDTYPMLKLAQTPAIEVHIVESGAKLGGIGEPGTPPIAPAVANALFAATGTRIRSLPLVKNGIEPA
ncbi:MAG TPA: molybdopterin cofactor-binding domain-containing protein, partial [Steroidobacteraceae bacterium]|nr:molybdopterin cofactor-binding domain-containing protein [Steroidobacteraceae bacterium]